ncbi:hypothetical protein G7Z17_g4177 [Cylindrodendrum hubeiense]|uniref:DUF7514 domain-containing protein n=1 Tax=Cylindrodendrum hubeiense TaxID=595255 RepID=A0A9P5HFF7_9HYPO|nr:hypothetical protein G7Z17_g4177 [Cylindrodendrum hubeiense]
MAHGSVHGPPPQTPLSTSPPRVPNYHNPQGISTGGSQLPRSQEATTSPDPNTFWGDLVIPAQWPNGHREQWQASPSLELLVNAIYHWADTTIEPRNEGGLAPEKVGKLLCMGEYSHEHNIYALCDQEASSFSFGSRSMREYLLNQLMAKVYDLYGLPYETSTTAQQSSSRLDQLVRSLTGPTARPLLTREGHLRFLLIGILIEPHTNFININRFLSKVPPLLNPRTGDTLPCSIPRHVFPATADPRMTQCNNIALYWQGRT